MKRMWKKWRTCCNQISRGCNSTKRLLRITSIHVIMEHTSILITQGSRIKEEGGRKQRPN